MIRAASRRGGHGHVNGKRFHRSAFVGQNGSEVSDLAQITILPVAEIVRLARARGVDM